MAKTRIKTTPTRMQKEALMASAAVTATTNIVTDHAFKKRLSVLKNPITIKKSSPATTAMPIQSTIIVKPPQRTSSISSTTSTISHTSDGPLSCADSPPPNVSTIATQNNGPTMAELTENAIKTLNAGLLAKSNALALKNRKVYMITEKCYDKANGSSSNGNGGSGAANGIVTGQKRKMYLIMEEKQSDKQMVGEQSEKLFKAENANASKKLTLFTDTTNGQLPQKFERILPEILNCIQAKKVNNASVPVNGKLEFSAREKLIKSSAINVDDAITTSAIATATATAKNLRLKNDNNERLPLTLPPKKNRTKIITTQIIPVNPTQHAIYNANGMDSWNNTATSEGMVVSTLPSSGFVANIKSNGYCKKEKPSCATPVIVKASKLMTTTNGGTATADDLTIKDNGSDGPNHQLHKNINLSTDFLFLMKMLPKLESIAEPQKAYVKCCIEDIINQYAANDKAV